MGDTSKNKKYIDILKRIKKTLSTYEGIVIMKKQYYTNSVFYYFLCLLFRFIHILSFCGDYNSINNSNNININNNGSNNSINSNVNYRMMGNTSIKQYLNRLTLFYLMNQLSISYSFYFSIVLIILFLYLIRILYLLYIVTKFNNNKHIENWIFPSKYQIIIDHVIFLFFPYIIEFLSFIYYMLFFPDKFFILSNGISKISLYIFIFLNTILIILYNIENYFGIICANKTFKTSIFDAKSYFREKNYKNNKGISYIYSSKVVFLFIILQNFVIFLTLDNFIKIRYKIIFKIIISVILFFIIIIILLCKINKFNYNNIINISIITILLFSLYTIIIDLILYLVRYRTYSVLNDIIYLLIKIFLSYMTYLLYKIKTNNYLQHSIIQILFQEKKNKKEDCFINSFYYLNQIMIKIKQENKIESASLLLNFLSKHINKCHKLNCNCKLFESFIKNEDIENINNEEESNKFINELLIILNYLFESAFIDYNIYNNIDLIILLSEHFCHLKNNPTFAFSLTNTFVLRNKNKLNKYELITSYELCQKYIYFLTAIAHDEFETSIQNNKIHPLKYKKMQDFKNYIVNIKMSFIMKKLMLGYINNELTLFKHKLIFDDALSYKFDESNENIIGAKINFYNKITKIENNSGNEKGNKKTKKERTFLYNVIYLLNNEKFHHEQIINAVKEMDDTKVVPAFLIFKYFLFYDLFFGQIPSEIAIKLYFSLTKKTNMYNGNVNGHDYYILKRRYNEENNRKDSKVYLIFEFKKEMRTKFFSENAALKLGYKQTDVINEKINVLLPNSFYKSHLNVIKQIIVNEQKQYHISKISYFFDKSNTVLYPNSFEGTLLYDLTKNLLIMMETTFNYENQYSFMLDNNFDLLANSKNFEDEYYLNQRILQAYNIRLMDILKIKQDKLYKIFEKEFIKIHLDKLMKKVKTEEYFIPQIYLLSDEKKNGINSNFFNSSKSSLLAKIANLENQEEKSDNFKNNTLDDDEEKKFIKRNNIKKSILELFINQREVIFHKNYTKTLKKGTFIENLAKELIKIPDNDLMLENDKSLYNLIMSSKQLINYLLTKNELANDLIRIDIQLSFYYDKIFYFFKIDDDKKSYLKISTKINFNSDQKSENSTWSPNSFNQNDKSRNKKNSNSKIPIAKKSLKNIDKINDKIKKEYANNSISSPSDKLKRIIDDINVKIKIINKDKFIYIIKWILSIIIICILIIYFVLIFFQQYIINISRNILYAYYYNSRTRDSMLYIHSILLNVYYEYSGLVDNTKVSPQKYQELFISLSHLLKENYYNFYDYYFYYNIDMNLDFNLLYNKKNVTKLRGYWEETSYVTQLIDEIEIVIYKLTSIKILDNISEEMKTDLKKFLFFKNGKETQEKIYTSFIKTMYYFSANYESFYKEIFKEFDKGIYNSYKSYIEMLMSIYIVLEILGLLFFVMFFFANIYYLYNSNEIIIKNVIFLFLDYSEEKKKEKKSKKYNPVFLKMIELKKLLGDFDLNRFEIYSKNIDNVNNKKFDFLSDKKNTDDKSTNNDKRSTKNIGFETKPTLGSKNNPSFNDDNQNSFKKKKEKDSNFRPINNSNTYKINNNLDSKSRRTNNSSNNILMESNSHFFRDKLNNNSINGSKDLLVDSINNSSTNYSKQNIKDKDNDSQLEKEKEDRDRIKDIILHKSNKATIFLIKVYVIIMIILTVIIIIFSIYKIIYTTNFNNKFKTFFSDFSIITNRYSFLFNYFNLFRTILIFPQNDRKIFLENTMEEMDNYFEEQNKKFLNVLSTNMDSYKEIIKLVNILTETKNNSIDLIKENICINYTSCLKYLNSPNSIFDSGVDFAYKTCVKDINNLYLNYKSLKNKTNITLINSTIINTEGSEFTLIELSLSNMFFYIEEKIFEYFGMDAENFNDSYDKISKILNIISIIISIFNFLFVIIIIFLTVSNYSKPIKDATYRIKVSYNFIKTYSLNNYMKSATTC